MKKSTLIITTLLTLLFLNVAQAQPSILWQKTYGGSGTDFLQYMEQTTDSGFIMVCYSGSNDSEVTGNHGGGDAWIVKTNSLGSIQWSKCFGGTAYDFLISVKVSGNYYYVTGMTYSTNGDVAAGNHGGGDGWVLKLDDTGGIVWQKVLGGSDWDFGNMITATADKGCIMTGGAYSTDGDVIGVHGGGDVWVVKFDSSGNIQWNKTYGGSGDEWGFDIETTLDGGYIIASSSSSTNGDITSNHGGTDCWIVKINDTGKIEWQKTYGGTGFDQAYDIHQRSDSSYTFLATTMSSNGDVSSNHGGADYWLVNINDTGLLQWQKTYGGPNSDFPTGMQQTNDGGYLLGGYSSSNNGDVTNNHGLADFWVVKTNASGTMQWQKCLGGTGNDSVDCLIQTLDGKYAIGGATTSINGDVTNNRGGEDCWLVKLDTNATTGAPEMYNTKADIKVYPTITTGALYIDMPQGFENAELKLLDMFGKEVKTDFSQSGTNRSVYIKNLAPAIYILQVINQGEVSSYRIVYTR